MKPDAPQSYHRFMNECLYAHVDIDPKNIHIPDGTIFKKDITTYAAAFEKAIDDALNAYGLIKIK